MNVHECAIKVHDFMNKFSPGIIKQVRHKQNKRVLSSDYWAYINWGTYIQGAYIRGGGAYIWNEVSVSTCGGLIHWGAYIREGLIVGGLRYFALFKVREVQLNSLSKTGKSGYNLLVLVR